MRSNISSGAEWENIVGYSRAVQIGNVIEVSGTTAFKDGVIAFPGDAYQQTLCILEIIEKALKACGAEMKDVIRTRVYLKSVNDWQAAGKAHGEYFMDIKPASTMLAVAGLIHPDMLVEIEATAVLSR
jgi:enamine deaminase RidA (YjgF/YER057c/UK114 family)